jgi:hypothetical protein
VNEDRFRKLFLLLVVAGISALFLAMIRPFVMTLLLAAILAGPYLAPAAHCGGAGAESRFCPDPAAADVGVFGRSPRSPARRPAGTA